jgi:hypothetical protein
MSGVMRCIAEGVSSDFSIAVNAQDAENKGDGHHQSRSPDGSCNGGGLARIVLRHAGGESPLERATVHE